MTKLTITQRRALKALNRGFLTGEEILTAMYDDPGAHTPQGVHQTLASLVRKGLAEKRRIAAKIRYRLTPEGKRYVDQALFLANTELQEEISELRTDPSKAMKIDRSAPR